MSVKDILSEAYSYVKGGWTKGAYRKEKRGHDCFCPVGALRMAAFGDVSYNGASSPRRFDYEVAAKLLYKAFRPRGHATMDATGMLIKINDNKTTTKFDVTKAFRIAIAKAA